MSVLIDVLAPADAQEFMAAVVAVHESAHAVIGIANHYTVNRIWANGDADPSSCQAGGVLFEGEGICGDAGALVALAARPAVMRYLRLLSQDTSTNLAIFEVSFGQDDLDAIGAGAGEDLVWLRELADDVVAESWDRILGLAQALLDAGGHLSSEALAAVMP